MAGMIATRRPEFVITLTSVNVRIPDQSAAEGVGPSA